MWSIQNSCGKACTSGDILIFFNEQLLVHRWGPQLGGRCKDSDRGRDNTKKALTATTGYWQDYPSDSAKFSSGAEEFVRLKCRQENQNTKRMKSKKQFLLYFSFFFYYFLFLTQQIFCLFFFLRKGPHIKITWADVLLYFSAARFFLPFPTTFSCI